MISVRQLAAALYGVWLLLKLDPRAWDYFEKTPIGFARSFLPALLLSRLHIIHSVIVYDPAHAKLALGPYLVVQVLSDVMSWVAFPFAMLYVCRLLNRGPYFLSYMVPYNWFQLPVNLVIQPVAILADMNVIPGQAAGFTDMFMLTLFFAFTAFIARIGLRISLMTAIGIVMLDFLLTLIINQVIARI